jgi:hypothetical protein
MEGEGRKILRNFAKSLPDYTALLNIVIGWEALLLRIRDISGSGTGPKADYFGTFS